MIPFRRRPFSLGSRIGLASIAILLAVQVIGLLAYRSDVEERREAELRNTVALGRSVAAVVEGFALDLERVTFATALLLGRHESPLNQEEAGPVLKALLAEYPTLRALFLTDPSGRVISTDSGVGVGTDTSARPYMAVLQGGAETTWSGTLSGIESGEVTVAFGRPVRREDGSVRAYLVVAFHAARMAERLPVTLPPDTDVSILDESGQLLYSSTEPRLTAARRSAAADPGVATALAGSIAPVRSAVTALGDGPRYGVYVPAGRLRWVVGVTRPRGAPHALPSPGRGRRRRDAAGRRLPGGPRAAPDPPHPAARRRGRRRGTGRAPHAPGPRRHRRRCGGGATRRRHAPDGPGRGRARGAPAPRIRRAPEGGRREREAVPGSAASRAPAG